MPYNHSRDQLAGKHKAATRRQSNTHAVTPTQIRRPPDPPGPTDSPFPMPLTDVEQLLEPRPLHLDHHALPAAQPGQVHLRPQSKDAQCVVIMTARGLGTPQKVGGSG